MQIDRSLVAGKLVVVTGASRGTGAAVAHRFHELGMRLALCARSEPALAGGPGVLVELLDVADGSAVEAFAKRVSAEMGVVDCWVNNASVLEPIGLVRETDPDDIARLFAINVMGVVHGSQAFVRQRRELTGGGGVLLNITSGAALVGQPGRAAYSASKAAVDRLSEALAAEEADAGIRVHAVAPGVVDTTMQETIRGVDERVWPDRERFVHLHRQGKLTSPGHVADWLAAIAFDPVHRPAEVVTRIPDEHPR